jgi:pimeloyl-ACP methyl ester carboxylesterase
MKCTVTRPSQEHPMPHRVEPNPKRFAIINGKSMAYVELGEGELVFLLLHGNPTSSYLWRDVMPGIGRARPLPGA